MKKLFLIATMALMCAGINAQDEVGRISITPKVGFNSATLTDEYDSGSRIGLAAGVEVDYRLAQKFSLSGGVMYSMQGTKDHVYVVGVPTPDYRTDLTIKHDYINVPLLANFYVVKGLALKAGLQPGFNVNSRYKYSGDFGGSGSLKDLRIDARTFDLSLPVGVSYEYRNVMLDARYNFGLTKVAKTYSDRNSVFQLTLGYKFTL